MLDAIERIEQIAHGRSLDDFMADDILAAALERFLERVSEASRHLPDDMKAAHPGIPWRAVADIGNVLRHAYDQVSPTRLWQIVEHDLPVLKAALLDLSRRST